MKKIFTMLGLIALSFTSCTKDEDVKSTAGMQKTAVDVSIATSDAAAATAKNVNRGTIPVTVKSINVKATSSVWSYVKEELFDLVASGGETGFKISDIAVGLNNFEATTTSYDENKVFASANVEPVGTATAYATAQGAVAFRRTHKPFVMYRGLVNNFNVLNAAPNAINFNMTTQHGRIIGAFVLADDAVLRANTHLVVTAHVDGKTDIGTGPIKNNAGVFEWSDADAVVGKSIVYTIKLYGDGPANVLLKTYTITRPIEASTSYGCIYTVDRDKVLNFEDKVTFSFQPWSEVDCADIYDDEGYNCNGYDKEGHYNKSHDHNNHGEGGGDGNH